jgi:hypothetical protein
MYHTFQSEQGNPVVVRVRRDHANSFEEDASLYQLGGARAEYVKQLLVGVQSKEVRVGGQEKDSLTVHLEF